MTRIEIRSEEGPNEEPDEFGTWHILLMRAISLHFRPAEMEYATPPTAQDFVSFWETFLSEHAFDHLTTPEHRDLFLTRQEAMAKQIWAFRMAVVSDIRGT